MTDLIAAIKSLHGKIGATAETLFAFAVAIEAGVTVGKDQIPYVTEMAQCGWLIFGLAVVVGMIKAFGPLFAGRPARGVIEGLGLGLLAGVIGGALGYGWHAEMDDVRLLRIELCMAFAMPVGSVLGLCFDLIHPDKPRDWRASIGYVGLGLGIAIFAVCVGEASLVPGMDGVGIVVGEIQLLFEVYLLLAAALAAFSFGWERRRFVRQYALLIALVAVARAAVSWVPASNICQNPASTRLSQWQIYPDAGMPETCPAGDGTFAATVLVLMLWTVVAYTIFYKTGVPGMRSNSRRKTKI